MRRRHTAMGLFITIVTVPLLLSVPGCTQEDEPFPVPTNVSIQRGLNAPENDQVEDTVIVSWDPSTDARVEGYAIYRAEQGVSDTPGEKTDFELQAITIATQYVDDEVRTTERYPTMRYFYQIAVIGPEGQQGPMSEELSIDYQSTK